MGVDKSLEERIREVRQRFIRRLFKSIPLIKNLSVQVKNNNVNMDDVEDVGVCVHKVAGSAKVFGFENLGKRAIKIQNHLDQLKRQNGETSFSSEFVSELTEYLVELEQVSTSENIGQACSE